MAMDALFTRCPHCATVFKVQAAHLEAAQGRVRCGACLQPFSAKQNLVRPLAKTTTDTRQEKRVEHSATIANTINTIVAPVPIASTSLSSSVVASLEQTANPITADASVETMTMPAVTAPVTHHSELTDTETTTTPDTASTTVEMSQTIAELAEPDYPSTESEEITVEDYSFDSPMLADAHTDKPLNNAIEPLHDASPSSLIEPPLRWLDEPEPTTTEITQENVFSAQDIDAIDIVDVPTQSDDIPHNLSNDIAFDTTLHDAEHKTFDPPEAIVDVDADKQSDHIDNSLYNTEQANARFDDDSGLDEEQLNAAIDDQRHQFSVEHRKLEPIDEPFTAQAPEPKVVEDFYHFEIRDDVPNSNTNLPGEWFEAEATTVDDVITQPVGSTPPLHPTPKNPMTKPTPTPAPTPAPKINLTEADTKDLHGQRVYGVDINTQDETENVATATTSSWKIEARDPEPVHQEPAFQLPGKNLPWKGLLFTAATLVGMFLLVSQWLWPQRAELRETEKWGPYIEQICRHLDCQLPPRRNVNKIELLHRSILKDSHDPKKLNINLLLRNHAGFDQAFPDIELNFTDSDGRSVATRRFRPFEYLGKDNPPTVMPNNVQVHISFHVVEPKPTVTGFEFRFLPATP